MDIKKIQELVGEEKEVIVCTVDGIEKKILTESIRLDLNMEHIYLKKLKIHKDNIVKIKKVQSEKDKWIQFTLSNKEKNKEKAIIVGEDFQITGEVIVGDYKIVCVKCDSFNTYVYIDFCKITSIY